MKSAYTKHIISAIGLIVAIIFALGSTETSSTKSRSTYSEYRPVSTFTPYETTLTNLEKVPVAVDQETALRFATAAKTANKEVVAQIILSEKVFAAKGRTKVRVIQKGDFEQFKIILLEGQYKGKEGWTDKLMLAR